MKWLERIGVVLALVGIGCVLFGGGRFVQDTATDLTNRIWMAGTVLAIFGVILVNIKSEWLFRE